MAFVKLVLLVFIAHLSSALSRSFVDVDGKQKVWDNLTTGDNCKDCIQIVDLLLDMLSSTQLQKEMKELLEEGCHWLSDEGAVKFCIDQIEKNFPLVITYLTSTVKPGQVCSMLGLCGSVPDGTQQEVLISHIHKGLRAALTVSEVQSTLPCTLCIQLIKTLEGLLPTEQSVAVDLLKRVCGILPASVRDRCESFIEKHVKMLLDLLLSQATPQAVCCLLNICEESGPLSDCDSCLTLAVLTRLHLGSNATELQTSSYLGSVCQLHPNALPRCDTFTQRHGHQLKGVLGKEAGAFDMCGRVGLCGGVSRSGRQGRDPCTLSSSYRCRDLKTAVECGTVSFCQKYAWK